MSWQNDGITNEANDATTRGWGSHSEASGILINESLHSTGSIRCSGQDWVQGRDNSGGIYPDHNPYVEYKDGGSITFDAFNRVTQMQDAAHRQFEFKYDKKNGDICQVTNEEGTWSRQIHHGKYTDEWKNDSDPAHPRSKCEVEVSPDGYSFTQNNQRTTYTPDGVKTKEYLSNQPYFTEQTLANGQHKTFDAQPAPPPCPPEGKDLLAHKPLDKGAHDSATPKATDNNNNGIETKTTPDGTIVTDRKAMKETTYDKDKHVMSVHDLKNNSQLNYDKEGHLTGLTDPRGRSAAFKDYDGNGNPRTVENGDGKWTAIGPNMWINDKPAKTGKGVDTSKPQYMEVQVNKDGYSMTNRHGQKFTHNADGSLVEEYKGIKTTTDVQGKVTKQFLDGSQVTGDPLQGGVQFSVKKGDTKSGHLNISGSAVEIVHAKGYNDKVLGPDIHAHIDAAPNAPVTALQDGMVVYTYNHDPKMAAKMHDLSPTNGEMLDQDDWGVINDFRKNNPNKDIVVMQCYDPKSQGIRYEIYAGLNLGNAEPLRRVKAGDVLGTAGDTGYSFAARKGRVSGKAIELTM